MKKLMALLSVFGQILTGAAIFMAASWILLLFVEDGKPNPRFEVLWMDLSLIPALLFGYRIFRTIRNAVIRYQAEEKLLREIAEALVEITKARNRPTTCRRR